MSAPTLPLPNSFSLSSFNPPDISIISGNAPDHVKEAVADPRRRQSHTYLGDRFGDSIGARLMITEVDILADGGVEGEGKERVTGKVVCETTVETDMLNGIEIIHGGCLAYLVDTCSGLSLMAYRMHTAGKSSSGVSQSLNIVYHSPATLGDTLRIVNTTMSVGNRTMSARTEIWNATHNRLVASGVHIKMQPSKPPAKL